MWFYFFNNKKDYTNSMMKRYTRFFFCIGLLFAFYKEVRCTETKTDIPVIYAVAGDVATIPCYVSNPVEDDEATMILWYRLDMPNPIYTLDIRNVPFKVARHFPSKEMDGRLKFNVNTHPPVLYITPVKREDEAEYKCRVDLRRARTLILHSRLVIIAPPSDPIIMDEHGQRVHGIVGPYDEGTRVVLICDVDGGDPPPTVTWWRGAILLDDEFIVTKRGFARNILTIPKIEREDLLSELSCQASNTNITTPRETRVRLDINLYPLSVSIGEPKYPLLAGEPYDIICETIGSRPRAITTWWLDDLKVGPGLMGSAKQHGNITSSVFQFTPKPEHNGKRLTCKSLNPTLTNVTMESEMLLKVHFVPILNISLGNPLNTSDIIEGTNVSIDCTVWANPKMSEVSWLFNERVIAVNKTEKSITSKFTLVLNKVNRKQGGKYRCLASNSVGQGSSSNFHLLIKNIPVCRHTYTKIYGVSESESVTVKCEVDAEPQDVIFRWSFMNDFETVVLQNFTANDTNSTITYSPRAENGYGMLSCWGRNSVGLQLDPCLIKIVPAGAPESPHGCVVVNQTIINLTVECEPGYNGSLFQIFHMEIYDSVIEHLEQNLTKIDKPIFVVNGLTPGSSYLMVIYASNVKGRSQTVALMASTLLPAEKRTDSTEEDIAFLTPLVIIIIAVLAFFGVGIVITILILKFHKSKRSSEKDTSTQDQTSNSETTKKELDDSNDTNGKGPDIIPFTIEAEVNKIGDQLQYLSSQESSPRIPIRQKYTHTVL